MAEMHPILWTRVTDRRLSGTQRQGRGAVALRAPLLRAGRHRAHLHAADRPGDPQLHRPPHHQDQPRQPRLRRQAHRRSASATPTSATACGPSIRCRRRPRTPATPAAPSRSTFDEFAKFVSTYDLDYTAKLSGVPKNRLEALAELYADPKVKVMSFWTMGFNQHTRGVWCNNLVYNLHLLTGKISTPGNSPFSLTGQPSACGTAREVGTFSHRLPADMVVTNPKHRAEAEHDLEAARGHDPRHAGLSRRAAEPHAQGRQAQRLLGDGQQQHAGGGQPDAGGLPGLPQPGQLHRRVRRLSRPSPRSPPTSSCRRRCGSRRKAPTATPSAARTSGTSWSTRRARRARTCGS